MSYEFYKVLHIASVMGLFVALGALAVLANHADADKAKRRPFVIAHGVAMVLIIVAGFGALARLGMPQPASWPAWVWAKVAIWLLFGGALTAIRQARTSATVWVVVLPLLGLLAAYLAVAKPTL